MVALAILAALAGLAGCDQDKVLYSGRNYLMFSDTLYHYAVQESNEKFEVPVSATRRADYDRTFAVADNPRDRTVAQIRNGDQSGDAESMPVRYQCLYRLLQGHFLAFQYLYDEYDPAPDNVRSRGRGREYDCTARTLLRRI